MFSLYSSWLCLSLGAQCLDRHIANFSIVWDFTIRYFISTLYKIEFSHGAKIFGYNQHYTIVCQYSLKCTVVSSYKNPCETFVTFERICKYWYMFLANVGNHFESIEYFPYSKSIEIVILWVYYTIPFGFSLFRHFGASLFNFLNYFVWLRITDEGSVPEMRIWSILLIKSDLKWCTHLSRRLFIL